VAGELNEPEAPRAVRFVARPPATANDKTSKRVLRSRYLDS
jgi:hypothetical protein